MFLLDLLFWLTFGWLLDVLAAVRAALRWLLSRRSW
jgi:hypothetical protein